MYNTFGQDNLDESINIGQTEKNLKEKKEKKEKKSTALLIRMGQCSGFVRT